MAVKVRVKRPSRKGVEIYGIYLGVFDVSVNILVGDRKAASRWVRYLLEAPDAEDIPDDFRGRCTTRLGYCPVVWIPRVPRTARETGTLVHELLHATSYVMRWADVPLTEETEEVFAHTLGWLVTHGLEQMGKKGRKR